VEWSWTIAKQKFVEWSWRWSGVCGVELRFLEWSSPKQPLRVESGEQSSLMN
jgi:hypothetical protein